ncbi:MAG: ATP-binding protein [Cyclobacteriaceae bacterium]|jgi:signal transduction histidine kinase/DNA-binding response OmpR family regulator
MSSSEMGQHIIRHAVSFIDAGVKPTMSFVESKKVRLINICAILAGGCTFPYLFHFADYNALLAVATSLSLLGFVGTIALNRRQWYQAARMVLIINVNLYLFTTASSLGRAAGEQMIYFPVIIGSVLVFAFQEKPLWWGTVGLSLLCLFVLEWTNYELFSIAVTPQEQHTYYLGNLIITAVCTIALSLFSFSLYDKQYRQNQKLLHNRWETEKVINYFSTSLFGKNTVDEILWDIAKNCISRLGLVDCVIYLLDTDRGVLVQKAAYGSKNPQDFDIYRPMEIPVGQGIVGSVAQSGLAEIITDTSHDVRYIADEEVRLSEITVPLAYQGQVLGVIDSEHPEKGFFTEEHLAILTTIASLCANKIITAQAEAEQLEAEAVRREAEKIKALDEAKSRFFTNISHEFRTPLTLIIGPLEQKLSTALPEEERHTTERMHRHAQRLLRLINQLLDFAKLEARQLQLKVQPGNITLFLQPLLASFQSQADQQSLQYHTQWPKQEISGYFDADKLEKIIYNLLSNALKFTPSGGTVTVIVAKKKQCLELQVRDSGRGISPKELSRIFDRFYQTAESSTPSTGGTGIGLALTRELVTLHHGTITVESISGKGARFTVTLPLSKDAYRPEDIHTIASVPAQPVFSPLLEEMPSASAASTSVDTLPTLLLVEDHQDLRTYLREQTASTYQVLEAADGEEGWVVALEHAPDLIICDWMMPHLDGISLCRRLKTDVRTSHIPIIMLTARADLDSKLAGLETGADAYLIKPFNPEELRIRLRKLIEQRAQLQVRFRKNMVISPQEITVNSTDERFLKQAVAVIEQQLSNPNFTVEQWQQTLGLSRMHLHRKLKALTNQSATEFIRTYRLKRAAQLLTQHADQVSQIAYQVGFSSLSYFTKSFKEQFGCTPSEHAENAN